MTVHQLKPKPPVELKAPWLQILLALADQKLSVLEIMKEVLNRTNGHVHLWQGALYTSIRALEGYGFVEPVTSIQGRARRFQLTREGHKALASELTRLNTLIEQGRAKGVG